MICLQYLDASFQKSVLSKIFLEQIHFYYIFSGINSQINDINNDLERKRQALESARDRVRRHGVEKADAVLSSVPSKVSNNNHLKSRVLYRSDQPPGRKTILKTQRICRGSRAGGCGYVHNRKL